MNIKSLGFLIAVAVCGCETGHVPKEVVRPVVVVRANIVGVREMPEQEAVQLWLDTGVYRGLTDEEWVNLMIMIKVTMEERD